MKAFISVSYQHRNVKGCAVDTIVSTLQLNNVEAFVFVDHYRFQPLQEQEMMQQAMADIDQCDLLIAEASHKAIGIGIEAGYAKGRGKKVIYIRQEDQEHSTTLSGISDYKIIYNDYKDLEAQLQLILLDELLLQST